jgi:hypothetical protein
MRLIHHPRRSHRFKAPRIPISQEEIAADLHYPATRRVAAKAAQPVLYGGRR